uniref:Uncharacterized protein n=1 Tax=Timema shepardi TaxID=629360 RepID=A0A7R9G208_TIMSH|nr:unnamed protein product [Timema shepardi]
MYNISEEHGDTICALPLVNRTSRNIRDYLLVLLCTVFVGTSAKRSWSSFLRVTKHDEKEVLIDVDSKTKEEMHDHLKRIICKSDFLLAAEAQAREKKDNPANFGYGCDRHCICEIPGQMPCPAVVPLPNHMRGKFIYHKD